MYITIQFPVSDIRKFSPERALQITKPTWPFAKSEQYLRSSGNVKVRNSFGLSYLAEDKKYCSAKKALKFSTGYFRSKDSVVAILKDRRFLFDGTISGRFELIFEAFSLTRNFSHENLRGILAEILSHEIKTPIKSGISSSRSLAEASSLLRRFYCYATTPYGKTSIHTSEYIDVSTPLIVVEHGPTEKFDLTGAVSRIRSSNEWCKTEVDHSFYTIRGISLQLLKISHTDGNKHSTRLIRVILLKLNAYKSSLEFLLGSFSKLNTNIGTVQSNDLQLFFNKEARNCFQVPDSYIESKLLKTIYSSWMVMSEDDIAIIKRKISSFRPNIERKIYSEVIEELRKLNKIEVTMKNEFKNNNISSVQINENTVNSKIEHSGQASQSAGLFSVLSQDNLIDELKQLEQALKECASEASQYEALTEVVKARGAAESDDESSVVHHLRSAGEWVLDKCVQKGLDIAKLAISQSLGL
ncbi:hypothetical protein ACVZHJ_17810 [Vibrio diabolicus]